jgi:hypothetical protein
VGYEKRPIYDVADADHASANDKQWVAILKNIPDTVVVSRRQQHLIRAS